MTWVRGLHHITGAATDGQKDHDFYTKVLGLRRVKTTINHETADQWHLFYGDHDGNAGTISIWQTLALDGASGLLRFDWRAGAELAANGSCRRTVLVIEDGCVLEKFAILDHSIETVFVDKVIISDIAFAGPLRARCE